MLNAGAGAANVVSPNNPYAPIVERNIFHLNPPQAAGDAAADATPPPKITPTGIMTIFGTCQALFTVDGVNKPGQPGKTESYILSEGQRQDDVEVTRIDEKSGVVTFNNHGKVQEIPLVKAPDISSTSTPASSGYFAQQQSGNTITPEVQMIMIAAQHAKAQQEGAPEAIIYPPTPIDDEAGVVPTPSSPSSSPPIP